MKLENPAGLGSCALQKSPGKREFGEFSVLGDPGASSGGDLGDQGRAGPSSGVGSRPRSDPKAGSQIQTQNPKLDPKSRFQIQFGSQTWISNLAPRSRPGSQTWIPDPKPGSQIRIPSQILSVCLCQASLIQEPPCPRCFRGSIPSQILSQFPSTV